MTNRIFIVPQKGMKVRDPKTLSHLPSSGDWKIDNPYWRRLVRDGDVTIKPASKAQRKTES